MMWSVKRKKNEIQELRAEVQTLQRRVREIERCIPSMALVCGDPVATRVELAAVAGRIREDMEKFALACGWRMEKEHTVPAKWTKVKK
jgi:hypothetical protein